MRREEVYEGRYLAQAPDLGLGFARGYRAFDAYLAYGAGLLIGLQTLINVGVSTGALPTKGLTLPFVSYGGNSLLVCCALAGLSFRVSVELNAEHRR